jgi:hypothetical protein
VLAAIQGCSFHDPKRPDKIRLPFGFRFCLSLWCGVTSSCYGVAEIGQCKPVRNPLGNQSSLIESALSKPSGVQWNSNDCTWFSASASLLSNAGVIRLHHEFELFTQPRADI